MFAQVVQTLVCQDIVFPFSWQDKEQAIAWVQFEQVKRGHFTVVVYDTHSKQKHYLPVISVCIIYNHLLLKTSATLHISLVERHLVEIVDESADTKACGSLYKLPTA